MKIRLLTCLPIFVVTGVVAAHADVVTLTGAQIQDAMLVQESLNDNYGGRDNFEVGVLGNGQVRTTVMRFDVTDPSLGLYAGGVPQFTAINSITLTMTALTSTNGGNMSLRVAANQEAQGDWVEGTGTSAPSAGDAGNVTYSERQEGVAATAWSPDTNFTRGLGDGLLGTESVYPGDGNSFSIDFDPLAGETLDDLVSRWATGNNEGVLINDFDRTGFARWIIGSANNSDAALQPSLAIDFAPVAPVPEPSSIALWTLLGLIGAAGSVSVRRRLAQRK